MYLNCEYIEKESCEKEQEFGSYGTIQENLEVDKIRLAYFTSLREIIGDEMCGQEIPGYVEGKFKGTFERLVDTINSGGELSDRYEIVLVVYDDTDKDMKKLRKKFSDQPWPKSLQIVYRESEEDQRVFVSNITHNVPSDWRNIVGNKQKRYEQKRKSEQELFDLAIDYDVDLVLTDSWLPILTDVFLRLYEGHVVNAHPAVTNPKNPNRVPGLTPTADVYERFHKNGYNKTGATIHFTNPAIDDGRVIYDQETTILEKDWDKPTIRIENYNTKQEVVEEGLLKLADNPQFRSSIRRFREFRRLYRMGKIETTETEQKQFDPNRYNPT
jgi:folate-dependent phosphoribosylglycinamide formyltransferase PurN